MYDLTCRECGQPAHLAERDALGQCLHRLDGAPRTAPRPPVTAEDVATQRNSRYAPPVQGAEVYAIGGPKGGIGKSRFARELAWTLQGVLVDLEWDGGSSTRALGYLEEERKGAPLIDALNKGRTPRPISGQGRKPDLVPAHTDFERNQPHPRDMGLALLQWAEDLGRRLVVDTHPGGCPSSYGAMSAASVTLVPLVMGTDEFRAMELFLKQLPDSYNLLVIPYKVASNPKSWALDELDRLVDLYHINVGPEIHDYSWMPDRRSSVPICAQRRSKRTGPFIDEVHEVAEAVLNYGS